MVPLYKLPHRHVELPCNRRKVVTVLHAVETLLRRWGRRIITLRPWLTGWRWRWGRWWIAALRPGLARRRWRWWRGIVALRPGVARRRRGWRRWTALAWTAGTNGRTAGTNRRRWRSGREWTFPSVRLRL